MRLLRLLAVSLAVLVAAPAIADAQVWKPKSRLKSPGAKTRKPTKKTTPTVKKKKAKKATPKKKKKKAKPRRAADDDFTIIEEDFPDED